MQIDDLTPYNDGLPQVEGELAVGWLDGDTIPSTGVIEPAHVRRRLIDELAYAARYLHSGRTVSMGIHRCSFCDGPTEPLCPRGRALWGSGEFRVRGAEGTVFVSPTLVAHYIEAHDYMPPREYIEAVLRGDFIPRGIEPEPQYDAIGVQPAPAELTEVYGSAVEVVLLEWLRWYEDEPHPACGLRYKGWVYGPWDGSLDHAQDLLSGPPMSVFWPAKAGF